MQKGRSRKTSQKTEEEEEEGVEKVFKNEDEKKKLDAAIGPLILMMIMVVMF